jgi:MFS transporter, ACS family, hexuronate transporter
MATMKTRVIAALWYLLLVNYLDRVAMGFAGPAIMKSLSMSPADFGLILSSFGLGYLLAQIPGGVMADRWGSRIILIIGPVMWAVFTGATAFATTLVGFVTVRILFGLSEGLLIAAIFKTVGDSFDSKERPRALAICLSAGALGPLVAGPLVGSLLLAFNWQMVFFALAAPALLASLIAYWALPRREHKAPPPATKRYFLRMLSEPSFWLMGAAYLGYNIAFWGYLGWMPSYLAQAHHINLKSMGVLGGIPYTFGLVGLLLVGWLSGGLLRRYHSQMIVVSLVCAGIAELLAYRAESLPYTLAGLCGAAFFLYGCWGSLGAFIIDLAPPAQRATYAGGISAAGQIGGLVAPSIVGFLVNASGSFASGFGFMIAALGSAAACMLLLGRSRSRGLEVTDILAEQQ